MKIITLDKDVAELHASVQFDSPTSAYIQIVETLREFHSQGADLVSVEVYAPKSFEEVILPLMGGNFPVNWILPLEERAKPVLAGAHFVAVKGAVPAYFKSQSGAKGAVYEDSQNVYCRTFGVYASLDNSNPYGHAKSNLENLEAVLRACGFAFTDIVRTWFYNDSILDWYSDFNRARTDFFSSRGVFNSLLPASTGIGAPNHAGALCVSGAFAVKSKRGLEGGDENFAVDLPSPLQGGATEYGSSFARAVEVCSPSGRRVMISGTASILPDGKTANVGDISSQVDLTLKVIEGILKSRSMSFDNTVNAVVYCLKPEYFELFKAWNKAAKIAFCPSYSTICRSDLLFEIELESFKTREGAPARRVSIL